MLAEAACGPLRHGVVGAEAPAKPAKPARAPAAKAVKPKDEPLPWEEDEAPASPARPLRAADKEAEKQGKPAPRSTVASKPRARQRKTA